MSAAAFVPIDGAWHGALCWSRVLTLLHGAGHAAHAVTLTGVGERAHLLSREIGLATHIADVVNLVECEQLSDVGLVGHRYGGLVRRRRCIAHRWHVTGMRSEPAWRVVELSTGHDAMVSAPQALTQALLDCAR